jgi:hypothetical protein
MTFMNIRILGLAAAAALMFSAAPALADCQEPIPPVAVDGGSATAAQMGAAHDDVLAFIKQSDDYQSCLITDFKQQQADAVKAKKDLDPSIEAAVNDKVHANQLLKEKVGAEYNAAVIAFKAKHPGG